MSSLTFAYGTEPSSKCVPQIQTFCFNKYSIVFACMKGMSLPVKSLSDRNSSERCISAAEKKELIPLLKSLHIALTTFALDSLALFIF